MSHACSCRLTSHQAICENVFLKQLKALLMGVFFICIKLGILSLCTEPWHGTRSISWDFCLYWKAIWWLDYVYIYWLWTHTHLSTTINLILNGSLIQHWIMSLNFYRYKLKLAKTANVNDVQNVDITNGEGKPKNQWRFRI